MIPYIQRIPKKEPIGLLTHEDERLGISEQN